jgi:4,5-DOPA dioxygenase extradiol
LDPVAVAAFAMRAKKVATACFERIRAMRQSLLPRSLFISHGAPNLLETDGPAHRFLKTLGNSLSKPRAILAVSAHFETDQPAIGTDEKPKTIHDFRGFSPSLHGFDYPARGAGSIARAIAERLLANGIAVSQHPKHGLDHGIWVPLALAYP